MVLTVETTTFLTSSARSIERTRPAARAVADEQQRRVLGREEMVGQWVAHRALVMGSGTFS
jgi:hypothetical protein